MTTIQKDKQQVELDRWRTLGFTIWTGQAETLFGAVTNAHKAAHKVRTTFWDSTCTECEWQAKLMVWQGNPFDPMRPGKFALAVGKTLYIPAS